MIIYNKYRYSIHVPNVKYLYLRTFQVLYYSVLYVHILYI